MKSLFFIVLFSSTVFAQDNTPLDPPYKNLIKGVRGEGQKNIFDWNARELFRRVTKNSVLDLIEKQSPVRAQLNRGTCSIFSATALLETLMVIHRDAESQNIDLSEEWLEYIKSAETGMDGSTTSVNISMFKKFGMPTEQSLPYIGETWEKLEDSELAQKRCEGLERQKLKKCLTGHRNPDLLYAKRLELMDPTSEKFDLELAKAREEAGIFKKTALLGVPQYEQLFDESEIKKSLDQGIPLLLDLDFFYGAWNHREAANLGINRNMEHWNQGIVGFPEAGSLDRKVSRQKPAGHSILVVGYNEEEEIVVEVPMEDGSTKEFRYKGVYYFKNSWGTDRLGANAIIEGRQVPGYGRITQQYAHTFGGFYIWNWSKVEE